MKHTLIYTHDWETEKNAVIYIGSFAAQIWRTGIKQYSRQAYAQKYLKDWMEEKIRTVEPDEIVKPNPGESIEGLENHVAGDLQRIAEYTRIYPNDPAKALPEPTVFYKCHNIFPPSDIWYDTEKEAKKDADGIDTVYVGPVEVYDQEVINSIREEMKSYAE